MDTKCAHVKGCKLNSKMVYLSVLCTLELYSVVLSIGLFNNQFNFRKVSL